MQLEVGRDGRDCSSPHLKSDSLGGSGLAIEVVSDLVDIEERVGSAIESVADALAIVGASGENLLLLRVSKNTTQYGQ
jgi:hypothetical protein